MPDLSLEAAKEFARIASLADGGCSVCVEVLREELESVFPQFKWTREDYKDMEVQCLNT